MIHINELKALIASLNSKNVETAKKYSNQIEDITSQLRNSNVEILGQSDKI